MIPVVGKLFLTNSDILLDFCHMKLLVCCLTCARVVGGHWALAAYTTLDYSLDTSTKGTLVGCSAISPISNFTACPEG